MSLNSTDLRILNQISQLEGNPLNQSVLVELQNDIPYGTTRSGKTYKSLFLGGRGDDKFQRGGASNEANIITTILCFLLAGGSAGGFYYLINDPIFTSTLLGITPPCQTAAQQFFSLISPFTTSCAERQRNFDAKITQMLTGIGTIGITLSAATFNNLAEGVEYIILRNRAELQQAEEDVPVPGQLEPVIEALSNLGQTIVQVEPEQSNEAARNLVLLASAEELGGPEKLGEGQEGQERPEGELGGGSRRRRRRKTTKRNKNKKNKKTRGQSRRRKSRR
jgi:hypothetical protein